MTTNLWNVNLALLGIAIENVLVKYRHTTEFTTSPLRLVLLEFWIYGFEERADEGNLPCRTRNRTFLPQIAAWEVVSWRAHNKGMQKH